MAHWNRVVGHLRRAALFPGESGPSDGHLLDRFLEDRDEAAFELLLRRHGPMVLGVCQRLLRNPHDVEDAFQATFLVLVRKAASIVPRQMVGNWLHGVAYRTALEARTTRARRQIKERQVGEMLRQGQGGEDPWPELRPLLDQELNRLPEKYRVLLVLCDLEGRPQTDVARQLGCPTGTVSGRLTRARRLLAKRLSRHGIALAAGSLSAVLSQQAASACVPTPLLISTLNAATVVAAGQVASAGLISTKVAALTEGVLSTMWTTKLKIVTVLLLAVGGISGGGVVYRTLAAEPSSGRPDWLLVQGAVTAPQPPVARADEGPVPAPEKKPSVEEELRRLLEAVKKQQEQKLEEVKKQQEQRLQEEQQRLKALKLLEDLNKAIQEQQQKQKVQDLVKQLEEALKAMENRQKQPIKEDVQQRLEELRKFTQQLEEAIKMKENRQK